MDDSVLGCEVMNMLLKRAEDECYRHYRADFWASLSLKSFRALILALQDQVRVSDSSNLYSNGPIYLQYSRGRIEVHLDVKLTANEYIWEHQRSYLFDGLDRACKIAKLGKRNRQ